MIDTTTTLATLRNLILEDKKQLHLWQKQFNAYFEHEGPIDYLDEAREIAHYLMELIYTQKELEQATAQLKEAAKDSTQLGLKMQSFHEEVLDFQSFFETFLSASEETEATAA